MIIQNIGKEVVIRFSSKINIDDLQDVTDWLEYKELTKKSTSTQKNIDDLVKEIKKNRWIKTKAILQK